MTELKKPLPTTTAKPTPPTPKLSPDALAKSIIDSITTDIRRRSVMGSLFNQLVPDHKKDMLDKWRFDVAKLIKDNG
jgi:hypothetical protein